MQTCPVFLQRSDIVKAVYEPTDEECEWKADEEEELTVSKQVQVTYNDTCAKHPPHSCNTGLSNEINKIMKHI